MLKKVFWVTLLFLLLISFTSQPAKAGISACSVSVSPQTLEGGSSSQLIFSITNNDQDSNLLYWVKIIAPSSDFSLTSGDGPSLGGVALADDKSWVAINTTLSGSQLGDFTVGVTAGNNGVAAASFTVLASASSGGEDPTTCTGDTAVAITGNTEAILNISNIKVSASDSSATVSWTTGGPSVGRVDYGTESGYGSLVTDSTSSTSHSVTLPSLAPNTTFHFRITSDDGNQNTRQTADSTFVTAPAGETQTVTTTVTTTTTTIKNIIQEVKDTTPPTAQLTTDLKSSFTEAPTIGGVATDDTGIGSVQYSLDGGQNWLNINISGSVGKKKATFQFAPQVVDDGNYEVLVLVTDSSGNTKKSDPATLIIDRLAPSVGGVLFSLGPIVLKPDSDGNINVVSGLHTTVTLSAVGGPVSVNLNAGTQTYPLIKNVDTGLWSGEIVFPLQGEYSLSASLIDGAQNHTTRDLHKIIVHKTGKITTDDGLSVNARMSLYVFDEDSNQFVLWNAHPFGQENPLSVSSSGNYGVFLTSGKFYIEIESSGYKKIRSTIFTVSEPTALTTDFVLHHFELSGLSRLLTWLGLAPVDTVPVTITPSLTSAQKNTLIGSEIPLFEITSQFRGKPTVLTFLTTWLPQASEQIEELVAAQKEVPEVHFVVVGVQNSKNKLDLFMKRGNYAVSALADPDGKFVEPLFLESLPTSVFLDRKGIIQSVFVGVIHKNQIKSTLIY